MYKFEFSAHLTLISLIIDCSWSTDRKFLKGGVFPENCQIICQSCNTIFEAFNCVVQSSSWHETISILIK